MAEVWKRVKLKDPITGEYLAPVTGQESDTIDADTLQLRLEEAAKRNPDESKLRWWKGRRKYEKKADK